MSYKIVLLNNYMAKELDSISPIIRLPGPYTFKYGFFVKLRGKHYFPFKYGNELVHDTTLLLHTFKMKFQFKFFACF